MLLALITAILIATSSISGTSQSGTWSAVTVLDIGRPVGALAREQSADAEDALALCFAVVRKPGAAGELSIRELRDFSINGERYSDRSRARLGQRFEPGTIIYDASDFKMKIRPDLARVVPRAPDADQAIMCTVISGARFQSGERGAVTIEVGWGTRTETFAFDFRLP